MAFINQRSMHRALFIMIGFLVTVVLIASVRAKKSINANEIASTANQSMNTRLPTGRVQVVRFTLYDVGIYPAEARVQEGPVTISIEDLSGGSSGVIVDRLEANVAVQVAKVDRLVNRLRARSEIRLIAGRYEIYDARRPNNRATIIVEP